MASGGAGSSAPPEPSSSSPSSSSGAAAGDATVTGEPGAKELAVACRDGKVDVIRALIAKGISVNDASEFGGTALHHAATSGQLEVVSFLLDEHRADVDSATDGGTTPLMLAAQIDHAAIINKIVAAGAKLELADRVRFPRGHARSEHRGAFSSLYFGGRVLSLEAYGLGLFLMRHRGASSTDPVSLSLFQFPRNSMLFQFVPGAGPFNRTLPRGFQEQCPLVPFATLTYPSSSLRFGAPFCRPPLPCRHPAVDFLLLLPAWAHCITLRSFFWQGQRRPSAPGCRCRS